ncbi:MAG TPA: glycosyltransferase, partial [Candidatus Omnitrophota bacterium]|nr:glycosyltransferase [Candidatus Omnitrophota bacterium]
MLPELAPTLVLLGLAVLVLPSLPRDHGPARAIVLAIAMACMGRYLLWRWTDTLPPPGLDGASLWMWLLAVMETLALGNAMLTALFLTRRSNRRADADAGEARLAARPNLPAVDVVIPTYNEPIEVVERSILGALALDWPDSRVWVLDDGRRPWLAEYCRAKGVAWITRDGNAHGKAGNVNAWLTAGGGEAPFVMVLDADFVPQARFLRRVMGFFDDGSVALVQTPQSFFNPDPIQMNLLCGTALADEQRFFYHSLQPSLDAWGAAFCCGTSFVVRRDRLLAAGGVPTCTVTEDMMTTYALASAGGRTVYLDEPLSAGLAAEGLAEFVGQRARWCLGTIQALRSPNGPLRARLGPAHLLCFLNAQLFWLGSVPLMLLAILAPAVFWWTGTPAFLAPADAFLWHFGPRFVAEAVAIAWVSRWSVVPVLSGVAPLVVAPAALGSVLRALFATKGLTFRVTLKGCQPGRVVVHGRMLAWLGAVAALIALGMAGAQVPELAPVAGRHAVNLAWSGYALGLLFLAMLVCIEIPRKRRHDRIVFGEPAWLDGAPVRLVDLSLGGACVEGECGDGTRLHLSGVG